MGNGVSSKKEWGNRERPSNRLSFSCFFFPDSLYYIVYSEKKNYSSEFRNKGVDLIQMVNKHMPETEIYPISESAVTVRFGTVINSLANQKVKALARNIEKNPFKGFIECTPAFTSVTVFYDVLLVHQAQGEKSRSPYQFVHAFLENIVKDTGTEEEAAVKKVEIPVCYGGTFGPDLPFVAEHNGLAEKDVVDLHTAGNYPVYMIGFAPGFPYLGGLSEKINAPRRTSPRTEIPAGSVGIAGSQTGVYPISTPGGWQLIGRTPMRLFKPEQEQPSLLKAGDTVKFVPITEKEFEQYQENSL